MTRVSLSEWWMNIGQAEITFIFTLVIRSVVRFLFVFLDYKSSIEFK